MTKPHELLEKFREAEGEVEPALDRFLRAMGWDYTCDTRALWLWKKEVDGKELRVNASTALHIAMEDCPWPYQGEECHPEGYEGSCGCDTCLSYADG